MAKHGGIDVSNDLPDDTALALQAELRTDTQSEPAVTLQDICSTCAITTEYVYELVELGVLEPVQGDDPGSWRFHSVAIQRSFIAIRLHNVLEVNPAGTALILDLLDELTQMRARVRVLEQLSAH